MGHSVHAVGFRLGYRRHWPNRLLFEGAGTVWQSLAVDRVLIQKVHPVKSPILLGFSYFRRAPFGRSVGVAYGQFTPLHRLLLLFRKRSRRRRSLRSLIFMPLLKVLRRFGNKTRKRVVRLWIPFLRWRFAAGWISLVDSKVPIRLVGVRLLPRAPLVCRFFLSRIRQGVSLSRLVNSFLSRSFRRLNKNGVLGLFLCARGRFTRSQLASVYRFRRGRVPLATMALKVDQVSFTTSLKYGACTLTLWVSRKVRRLCTILLFYVFFSSSSSIEAAGKIGGSFVAFVWLADLCFACLFVWSVEVQSVGSCAEGSSSSTST